MNLNEIVKGIQNGLLTQSTGCRSGCGRAYVVLSSAAPKAHLELFKKACAIVGVRYIGRAYGTGSRAAYIGYDNADGRALAQAEAISKNLRALGLDVYDDGVGD